MADTDGNEKKSKNGNGDEFYCLLYAIRKARMGDERLNLLFGALNVNLSMDPVAIFGFILSQAPLSAVQAQALKEIIEMGAE